MRVVDLTEVVELNRPGNVAELARGKSLDGRIELRLRDGSIFEIESDLGRQYIGLVNVFKYVARMNRQSEGARQVTQN
jgi:hypothetical protein